MNSEVEEKYQAKKRNTAVPAAYLILKRSDGNILLALRQNTGYQDGNWELPAGHVDEGELPTQGMVREAGEEIGIITDRSSVKLVHTSYRPVHDKTGNRVDFIFLVENWSNDPKICEPEKCAELRWFKPTELPDNLVPHNREFIRNWLAGVSFSEFDVEWLKAHDLYKI